MFLVLKTEIGEQDKVGDYGHILNVKGTAQGKEKIHKLVFSCKNGCTTLVLADVLQDKCDKLFTGFFDTHTKFSRMFLFIHQ